MVTVSPGTVTAYTARHPLRVLWGFTGVLCLESLISGLLLKYADLGSLVALEEGPLEIRSSAYR